MIEQIGALLHWPFDGNSLFHRSPLKAIRLIGALLTLPARICIIPVAIVVTLIAIVIVLPLALLVDWWGRL